MNVLLVDDNPGFLAVTTRFLRTIPRVGTIVAVQTGGEALAMLASSAVDLVLLDIGLPDMNGLELARQIKAWPAPPRVLMITMHNLPEYRAAAMMAGADGFLSKTDVGEHLLPLIDSLFAATDNDASFNSLSGL